MTNTKHTPAPWIVRQNGRSYVIDNESWDDLEGQQSVMGANARLIAAAPELLAALETLAEHFEYFMGDNECRPLENARAAIAKAKGE